MKEALIFKWCNCFSATRKPRQGFNVNSPACNAGSRSATTSETSLSNLYLLTSSLLLPSSFQLPASSFFSSSFQLPASSPNNHPHRFWIHCGNSSPICRKFCHMTNLTSQLLTSRDNIYLADYQNLTSYPQSAMPLWHEYLIMYTGLPEPYRYDNL